MQKPQKITPLSQFLLSLTINELCVCWWPFTNCLPGQIVSSLWTGSWYSWYTINVKVASFFLPSSFSTTLHCGSYVDCTIIQHIFQLWQAPIVSFNRHTKTFQSFDFHADLENSSKRLFFSFDSLTKPDQPKKTNTGPRRRRTPVQEEEDTGLVQIVSSIGRSLVSSRTHDFAAAFLPRLTTFGSAPQIQE